MPQGLQIFNEKGEVIFDVNSQAVRFCGVIEGGTIENPISGSITVPAEFVAGNNKVFYLFPESPMGFNNDLVRAVGFSKVWIEGRTVHYLRLPTPIYYGVY